MLCFSRGCLVAVIAFQVFRQPVINLKMKEYQGYQVSAEEHYCFSFFSGK